MTTRPPTARSGRQPLQPVVVPLPTTEDPQVVDQDGYEVVQHSAEGVGLDGLQGGVPLEVNADGEIERPGKVLSIADSLVLIQALRQTRHHHLTSLFPLFPSPQPKAKAKPKVKPSKPGSAADTPTVSTPEPASTLNVPEQNEEPPVPPHAIHPIGKCRLSLGPMRFDDVMLWECSFNVPPPSKDAVEEAERKKRLQAEKKRQQAKKPAVPPAVRPSPHVSRPPTAITPALIALVNAEARIHPWLNALISIAAQNKASQEELRRLGGVVERLSKGFRVDGSRIEPQPQPQPRPPAQAAPIAVKKPPSVGVSTQSAVAPRTPSTSSIIGPRPPATTTPMVTQPAGLAKPDGSVTSVTPLPPAPGLEATKQPARSQPGTFIGQDTSRSVAPAATTVVPQTTPIRPLLHQGTTTTAAAPSAQPANSGTNTMASVNVQPSPSQLGGPLPQPSTAQDPRFPDLSLPPPVLLLSFPENPSDKFVIPTELAFISYKKAAGDVKTPTPFGKILISTFIPAAGWPKWVPPSTKRPETPANGGVPQDLPTGSAGEGGSFRAIQKGNKKAKVEVEGPPSDLPCADKPFGPVGGVIIPPGNVQPITVVLEHVHQHCWHLVSRILFLIDAHNDGGKRLREEATRAEQERLALERREREERERKQREMHEQEERERKEKEEEEAAEAERMSKRARRSTAAKPKEQPVVTPVEQQPTETKIETFHKAAVKEKPLKQRIFQVLLERVPPRMFLKHQLPEPLPQELINASGHRSALETYNAGSKVTFGANDEDDFVEVPQSRKRRAPSPTITFELPMSFEGMEEAIAKSAPKPRRQYPGGRPRPKRAVEGKICEGCAREGLNVWRVGPGGMGTLCNSCGDNYKAGLLGPLKAPGATKAFLAKKAAEEERSGGVTPPATLNPAPLAGSAASSMTATGHHPPGSGQPAAPVHPAGDPHLTSHQPPRPPMTSAAVATHLPPVSHPGIQSSMPLPPMRPSQSAALPLQPHIQVPSALPPRPLSQTPFQRPFAPTLPPPPVVHCRHPSATLPNPLLERTAERSVEPNGSGPGPAGSSNEPAGPHAAQ